jgi:hypothetical protein
LKTLVRLVIAALLLNAGVRVGTAFWRYLAFKDSVEQLVRFSDDRDTAATLHQQVLMLAKEHGIDIYPADVEVKKERTQTTVSALYGEQLELVPRLYRREHLFEFEVSVEPVRAPSLEDAK